MQTRADIEAEIALLKNERGQGKLDGRDVAGITAKIAALQDEAEALSEADGALAMRERDAAEQRRLGRLAELRSELAGLEEERLGAIERANAAALNLRDALNAWLAISKKEVAVAHAISGEAAPGGLMHPDIERRIVGRLSGVLCGIKGCEHRLRGFVWEMQSLYPATQSWRDAEEKLLAGDLTPLIADAKPKAQEAPKLIERKTANA